MGLESSPQAWRSSGVDEEGSPQGRTYVRTYLSRAVRSHERRGFLNDFQCGELPNLTGSELDSRPGSLEMIDGDATGGRPAGLPPPYPCYCRTRTTTRRFCARPSREELSATGFDEPIEMIDMA